VLTITPVNDSTVKVKVKTGPDCRIGEHAVRLRTALGITEARSLYVEPLPDTAEKEPNSDFTKPQKVGLNTVVSGVVDNEDVDYFAVDLKKGQRLSAEVFGMRLGGTFFDPYRITSFGLASRAPEKTSSASVPRWMPRGFTIPRLGLLARSAPVGNRQTSAISKARANRRHGPMAGFLVVNSKVSIRAVFRRGRHLGLWARVPRGGSFTRGGTGPPPPRGRKDVRPAGR